MVERGFISRGVIRVEGYFSLLYYVPDQWGLKRTAGSEEYTYSELKISRSKENNFSSISK
jgi:hypothetical protein